MTKTSKPPRKARLIPADEVFAKWRKDPGYKEAYDALEEEFAIMSALIKARAAAGLSQSEVAKRMKTTQPAVARLEGGAHRASLKTIKCYAAATGHRVKISLEPITSKR
jgi:ribosome-binding protein aMBF1 (putative translation factor)